MTSTELLHKLGDAVLDLRCIENHSCFEVWEARIKGHRSGLMEYGRIELTQGLQGNETVLIFSRVNPLKEVQIRYDSSLLKAL